MDNSETKKKKKFLRQKWSKLEWRLCVSLIQRVGKQFKALLYFLQNILSHYLRR